MSGELERTLERLHDAQRELEELRALESAETEAEAMRETLGEVASTLKQIADDAKGTAGQIDDVSEKAREALDLLKKFHAELGEAIEGTLQPVQAAAGEVGAGVKQFGEAAEKVSEELQKVKDALDQVERLIELGEADAADILDAFGGYFGTLTERLGTLVGRIPGLGAFITIWITAIQHIAGDVRVIQDVYDRHDSTMREVFGKDLYFRPKTDRQRRRERIEELERLIEDLSAEVGVHPDSPSATTPEAEPTKVDKDVDLARRAAESRTGISLDGALADEMRAEWRLRRDEQAYKEWQERNGVTSPDELRARLEDRRERESRDRGDAHREYDDLQRQLTAARDQEERLRIATELARVRDRMNPPASGAEDGQRRELERGERLEGYVERSRLDLEAARERLRRIREAILEWLRTELRARGSGPRGWTPLDYDEFERRHGATIGTSLDPQEISTGPSENASSSRSRKAKVIAAVAVLALLAGGTTVSLVRDRPVADVDDGPATSGPRLAAACLRAEGTYASNGFFEDVKGPLAAELRFEGIPSDERIYALAYFSSKLVRRDTTDQRYTTVEVRPLWPGTVNDVRYPVAVPVEDGVARIVDESPLRGVGFGFWWPDTHHGHRWRESRFRLVRVALYRAADVGPNGVVEVWHVEPLASFGRALDGNERAYPPEVFSAAEDVVGRTLIAGFKRPRSSIGAC